MSRSPVDVQGEGDAYLQSWRSINSLLRQEYSWSGHERNCALIATPGGFAHGAAALGLNLDDDGRAAVRIDWDWDGDLDLLVANRTGPRLRLLLNEGAPAHGFLSVRLSGGPGHVDPVGARVELRLNDEEGPLLMRGLRAGEGFLAQQSSWLHFGLGGGKPHSLVVRWPDGLRESFSGHGAGGRYVLTRGTGRAEAWKSPTVALSSDVSSPEATPTSSRARVVLSSPVPIPTLQIETEEGRQALLLGVPKTDKAPSRRPLLLCLWAEWCAPCKGELRDIRDRFEDFQQAGIQVVALNADEPAERAGAQEFLNAIQWPGFRAHASSQAVDVLDVLRGAILDTETRLPLPASFLFDGQGRLVSMYMGGARADEILADQALLEMDPVERRDAAVPFPGTWLVDPASSADLSYFEQRFRNRGLETASREYMIGGFDIKQGTQISVGVAEGRRLVDGGKFEEAAIAFQAAAKKNPRDFDAHSGLGIALHRLKRFGEAEAAYRAALELRPNSANDLLNLGLVVLAQGKREDANEVAKRLAALKSPMLRVLEQAIIRMDDR